MKPYEERKARERQALAGGDRKSVSSMAAVAIAIGSGGALSKCETTPLLTVEETLNPMGRVPGIA